MDDMGQQELGPLDRAQYERELQKWKLDHSMLQEFADSLTKQLQESAESLQQSRRQLFDVTQSRDNAQAEASAFKEEINCIKSQKLDLTQLLDKKNDEVTALKETIKTFGMKSLDSNRNSSNDTKLKEIELEFQSRRLDQEKELYVKQINLLNEDIQEKNNELLRLRKDTNMSTVQANLKIEQQLNETNRLHFEITQLKGMVENKEKANSDLSKKFVELQVETTKLECHYSKEAETQQDIINMFMKSNGDLQTDLQAKSKDINDLRDLLQKGYEAHNALETEFENMKKSYITDIKELESEKEKMNKQLERANLFMAEFHKQCIEKEFEKHFPLAVENNRQLKIVSLTDLYDGFVQNKQENLKLLEKNAQLEYEIHNLKEKLTEEKPILYKNLQEYDMIISKYNEVQNQIMHLQTERELHLTQKDQDSRLINTFKREIHRYKVENQQLSFQIQHFLNRDQEAKGYSFQNNSVSSTDQSISGIHLNLIAFKDIQDLQEKNRELLQLLSRMQDELESDNKSSKEEEHVNLLNELDECKQEIANLKNELSQKDDLLERGSKQQRFATSDENCDFDPDELAATNRALMDKNEKYLKEIELNRNEAKENMSHIRKLENDKQLVISENVSLKSDLATFSSQLDNKIQHLNDVTSDLKKYQAENISLRERNIKLNATVENLEKNIIYVKDEIDSVKEAQKMCERNLHLVEAERDLYKNNEKNLHKEHAFVKQDLEEHKKIIYSLKAVQENLNRVETDTNRSMQVQIQNLQKSSEYYRDKVDKQEEKWKNSVNDFSAQINNLQILLDKEKNNNLELQRNNFDLQLKLQQQVSKDSSVNNQTADHSDAVTGDVKKQLFSLQNEIKMLNGKLVNSDDTCENLKSLNSTLEENLAKLIRNNEELKTNIDEELQKKISMIVQLNDELHNTRTEFEQLVAQKDEAFEQLNISFSTAHQQIEQLNRELIAAKEAIDKAEENEQQLLGDLNFQRVIANKAIEDYEKESNTRLGDADAILELQLKAKELEKSLLERETELNKWKEQAQQNASIWETKRKALLEECEDLKIRCGSLESVNGSLLSQVDQLNNQVIALQNNSTLFSLDENSQKENATQLLSVVKFLREEKSELQSKLAKANDENMCIRIEKDNYSKMAENLKNSLEIEKQSSGRLSNLNEFNDLVAKAGIVPVLTETNSQMRMENSQLEKRCNELTAKVTMYESNEKSVTDLVTRAEDEAAEKQFLRNEIDQWKAKANTLTQQLKNFDSDSFKRVMGEKTQLSKQSQTLLTERNKLKQELDLALNRVKTETEEKTKVSVERDDLKVVNNQLRNLARKYKAEMAKVKEGTESRSAPIDTSNKEVQCDAIAEVGLGDSIPSDSKQALQELQIQLEQKESENNRLTSDIQKILEDNEALRKTANEKDEKAKKIAEKAKQRLSESSIEKSHLLKEKESLTREIEELKSRILGLQTNDEQRSQYINVLKSQYDSKITQQDKELFTANKQIESLTQQLQQPSAVPSAMATPTTSFPTCTASSATSSSGSTSARLSVPPQQQQPSSLAPSAAMQAVKTTPTASIKPLTVAASRSLTATRTSTVGHRPVTMVQPTANAEDNSQSTGANLPQATVQPTQPQLPPSSVAVSSSMPFISPSSIEISEASTSQSQIYTPAFVPTPSTSSPISASVLEDKKRSFDSADEPTSSNSKKMKVDTFSDIHGLEARNEENSDIEIELEQPTQAMEDEPNEPEDIVLDLEGLDQQGENSSEQRHLENENEIVEDESEDDEEEGEDEESVVGNEEADLEQGQYYEEASDSGNDVEEEVDEEEERDVEDENDDFDNSGFEDEEEEDEEDEEDEESDDSSSTPEVIEVIDVDDSDDDADQNGNVESGTVRDEVSSSHPTRAPSNVEQTSQASNDLTTTTNEDGSAVQSIQPANTSSFQFDSNSQPSNTSQEPATTSNEPSQTNEMASSTSATNLPSSSQRRPVTWPQNDNPSQSQPVRPLLQLPQQPGQNRRQLHVRGNRMAARRGNPRLPRGNFR